MNKNIHLLPLKEAATYILVAIVFLSFFFSISSFLVEITKPIVSIE